MSEEKINSYQQALLDATVDACLYGNGFIRVTKKNTGFEVAHIPHEDFEALLRFMKDNKRDEDRHKN